MSNVNPSAVPASWVIGLDPWIVQDGNYGEFAVGETHAFALEFETREVAIVDPRPRSVTQLGGTRYRVDAPVVLVDGNLWMIDVGVLAYSDAGPLEGASTGALLSGEIVLGVDPFPFFEHHATLQNVPAAIYTWRITAIRELIAPEPPQNVYLSPEELDWTSREVLVTDAWNNPAGVVRTYELVCERLDVAPRRQR